MFSFLNNIPQVTRNLLILNVLMFLFANLFPQYGSMLSGHYVNSPLFEPYQIISHFFMHADLMHIFFNMFALVMFGGFLERLWGPKRFFTLYICSAIGAYALYNAMGAFEIMQAKSVLSHQVDIPKINELIRNGSNNFERLAMVNDYLLGVENHVDMNALTTYFRNSISEMVGASGAVFGILAAFALLFPNTQLQLLFPPIPIKAKYLIGGYVALEILLSFSRMEGDTVAHLAHVGGAIVGAIFVLFWRKDRTHFY